MRTTIIILITTKKKLFRDNGVIAKSMRGESQSNDPQSQKHKQIPNYFEMDGNSTIKNIKNIGKIDLFIILLKSRGIGYVAFVAQLIN